MKNCIGDTTHHSQRRNQRGYNLVEVLIAMAILASVLLSIATLFFMGRKNVYSGKQMTHAIAVGTRVLEDISAMSRQNLFAGVFAIPGTSTGANVTIGGVTYPLSHIRSTSATAIPSPPADIRTQACGATPPCTATPTSPPDYLTRWNTQLGNDAAGENLPGATLGNGSVSVVMQLPRPGAAPFVDPTNDPPQFATCPLLRVFVIVQWDEGQRRRNLVLETVKTF